MANKAVLYIVVLILSVIIIFLTKTMADRPFNTSDMRSAYYHGCNLGSMPITDSSIERCIKVSDSFKEYLDSVMGD